MKFRADIEGLRGVAVILVVLAHAGTAGFGGGFIGVDIFFVISGFLITGLIDSELRERGRIDFWKFYARRARRLAPALLAMLAIVAALCLWLLPSSMLAPQFESGFWSSLWLSNMYFALAHFDYFGTSAQGSLSLHTWSLGVEEQFYLLWPLLLLVAWRQRWPAAWLPGVIVASFILCQVLMPFAAELAYYSMPTRLWQLALGGLGWQLAHSARASTAIARMGAWLGAAGLGLLAAALVLIDQDVTYPGLLSLLPALAAVALIVAGTTPEGLVTRLLASPVLRLPGRISYSWYLWHWPLLTFWPLTGVTSPSVTQVAASVLGSFALAWISTTLVEQPVRRSTGDARTAVVAALLASIVLAALFRLAAVPAAAGDTTVADDLDPLVRSLIYTPAIYRDKRCDEGHYASRLVPCAMGLDATGPDKVVLIGDSVGAQWIPAVEQVARARGASLVVLTKSACPIVDEPIVYAKIHRRYTECEAWRESALGYVAQVRPVLVVIGTSGAAGYTLEQWRDGTARILARIAATAPVVVIAPTPLMTHHGPRCAIANGRRSARGIEVDGCEDRLADIEKADVIDALRQASSSVPGTHLLRMNDVVCPDGRCRSAAGGKLLYRDEQHLNADFVAALGAEFARRVQAMVPVPAPAEAAPAEE